MTEQSGFLARWSHRKAQARDGTATAEPAPAVVAPAVAEEMRQPQPQPQPQPQTAAPAPAPTLADVSRLTRDSDYSRFVAGDVDATVKHAALKHLFGDPHFNVMDGLDTYIDDYNLPDPLPRAMLRRMAQTSFLGLLAEPESHARAASPVAAHAEAPPDEDPDLRLQPDDAARRPGPEPRAGEDPGREL